MLGLLWFKGLVSNKIICRTGPLSQLQHNASRRQWAPRERSLVTPFSAALFQERIILLCSGTVSRVCIEINSYRRVGLSGF